MSKSTQKKESIQAESKPPKSNFRYICPACTNSAVEPSNQMLGVEVDCKACGARVKLDDPERYVKL